MIVLGLDTSESSQSVALQVQGECVFEDLLEKPPSHSTTLIHHIERALQRSGKALKDLSLLAVTVGPGSFTGLRIGLATVKALGMVHGTPAVGVSTSLALAFPHLVGAKQVYSCQLGGRGELYVAGYSGSPPDISRPALLEPQVQSSESFFAELVRDPTEKWVVGRGAQTYREALTAIPQVRLGPEGSERVRGSVVAKLGELLYQRGMAGDVARLRPLYLKVSEAERKRLASLPK